VIADYQLDALAAPNTFPIPPGRGRWRFTLHARQFADETWSQTLLVEMMGVRGRQLTQQLNAMAELTFTLDGHSSVAKLISELEHDVVAWRWDDRTGRDVPYFRGVIDHSEDQLDGNSHVVTYVAHDYFGMLSRRFVTSTLTYAQVDQDGIVADLLSHSRNVVSTAGTSFVPGSYLPLYPLAVAGDGEVRGPSTQLRDRTYLGSQQIDTALTDLAAVIGGFDFDVVPGWRYSHQPQFDYMRVFYPSEGQDRTDPVLQYGASIAKITRTVTSTDYANFDRVLGNNASSDPNAAQLYSEKWNSDSNNVTVNPIGLWMNAENAADVSVGTTLDEQAMGTLNDLGVLMPSYTMTLTPDVYFEGIFGMGDNVPVIIQSGRLNVNEPLRIVGFEFDIGDDGQEDVSITVSRPLVTLLGLVSGGWKDVNALARR
jgi:hypothetical protein